MALPGTPVSLRVVDENGNAVQLIGNPDGSLRIANLPAAAVPTDSDTNTAVPAVLARLQAWDPTANGGAGGWVRVPANAAGQPIVMAAIVDANSGNAFDALAPLPVEDVASAMTPVNLAADTTFSAPLPKMVYVGTAGILKIDCPARGGGASVGVSVTVPQGFFRMRGITKIYSTVNGTTALGLFACD
jgi:hypothetical protein